MHRFRVPAQENWILIKLTIIVSKLTRWTAGSKRSQNNIHPEETNSAFMVNNVCDVPLLDQTDFAAASNKYG